jgi:hypothetical protein
MSKLSPEAWETPKPGKLGGLFAAIPKTLMIDADGQATELIPEGLGPEPENPPADQPHNE